jgi:hypothetical protein
MKNITIYSFLVYAPYGLDEDCDPYQQKINIVADSKESAQKFLEDKGYSGIDFDHITYAFVVPNNLTNI